MRITLDFDGVSKLSVVSTEFTKYKEYIKLFLNLRKLILKGKASRNRHLLPFKKRNEEVRPSETKKSDIGVSNVGGNQSKSTRGRPRKKQ